ncbi:MAG: DUF3488 and transglutaminase-like domain-containing protein [Thermoanaerobaculia bacterium]
MTYAREKRLLLGFAALLAPLPLPLNQMLEWSVLLLYEIAVVLFLVRAARGADAVAGADDSGRWLSNRALNLLGLGYLPVLVLDIAANGRIQTLRPVLHLALFGVLAKLWSLREEKQKWQTWMGIFFLFLAAMATSVHPSVVLYLVVFLGLTVVLMLRFVYLHVLASFGHRDASPPELPVRRFLAGAILATLVLAVPLFALLPRIRSPYIMAAGGGGGQLEARAGFSDAMSLDLIGRIRDNREIAMRLNFTGATAPPGAMRFKAATYDIWEGRTWRRSERARTLRRNPKEDVFHLAPSATNPRSASVQIFLEPLRSNSLILPMESVSVGLDLAAIDLDRGGAIFLKGMPGAVLEYRVELGATEISLAPPPLAPLSSAPPLPTSNVPAGSPTTSAAPAGPAPSAPGLPSRVAGSLVAPDPPVENALDLAGVTPRIAELAAGWAGAGTPLERARRIERHLLFEYGYTLEFIGRGGNQPIENFLFVAKRGHCEYFASAMVLLLRSQGIPARLVTGFYGAEYTAWERSWVVRQSNAHAWVEGYVPEKGWIVFDPTPPVGRPSSEPASLLGTAREAWEFVLFRWDRYVISFDFYDQVGIFFRVRSYLDQFMRQLFAATDRTPKRLASEPAPAAPTGTGADASSAATGRWRNRWLWAVVAAFVVAAIGAALVLRRREPWSATRVYVRLRAALAGSGLMPPAWLGPLALAEFAERRLPEAGPATARLIAGYLRESFAGEASSADGIESLREDLAEVERLANRALAESRRANRRGGRQKRKTIR